MHHQAAVARASLPVPASALLLYLLRQAFLWLAVPLALYLVFATQIPALHDLTHTARHAAGWFKCH